VKAQEKAKLFAEKPVLHRRHSPESPKSIQMERNKSRKIGGMMKAGGEAIVMGSGSANYGSRGPNRHL
jgi:hypothetical protein